VTAAGPPESDALTQRVGHPVNSRATPSTGFNLRADSLRKAYGDRLAVADVSFEVFPGETLGFLGPNGAGKTTTLLIVAGALRADSGSIEIASPHFATSAHKRTSPRCSIGLAPQACALYLDLDAEENVRFFGRLYGLSGLSLEARVDAALELAALGARRRDRVRTFSGGMQRRLNIACALVHEPKVLLLDEPTAGVDPQSRNHIFDCLAELKQRGLTLVYCTHHTAEAEQLCDRVAIFDHGRILALDTVPALIARHAPPDAAKLEAVLLRLTGTSLRD
jgi:ABC-2 type transport system ATP-binding protein